MRGFLLDAIPVGRSSRDGSVTIIKLVGCNLGHRWRFSFGRMARYDNEISLFDHCFGTLRGGRQPRVHSLCVLDAGSTP
jgi:hypothetical protein